MDSYAILDDSNVVVNILVGKPYDGKFIKLIGDLEKANIGDEIKGGQIVRPEPTALEIWQEKVRVNRQQTGENIEDHQYNLVQSWDTKKVKHQAKLLRKEYRVLKKEAPDGWTIDKRGYAVQK